MQTVSETYRLARADPSAWHEYKAIVDGVEYGQARIMGAPETVKSLFSGNTPTIGCCVAQTVRIALIDPSPHPSRMAEIQLFCRVHGNGVISEWIPKGVFYIDTRDSKSTPGVLILEGYDAMLKMESEFTQGVDDGNWPRSMPVLMDDIAERIGVEIENAADIPEYMVPYTEDLTMREIAGYIAVAAAGNWIITDAGNLRLVKFGVVPEAPINGSVLVTEDGYAITFGGVRIIV